MKYLFIMAVGLLVVTCADPMQEIENEILITQPQSGEGMEEEKAEIVCYFGHFELEAKFPGGITAWENHLTQYLLKQPRGAGIEGKVFLAFRVKASGKITNIQVSRGITPEADQIAINVLKASPDWIPGKTRDGNPIDSNMAIMIRFGLNH